MKMRNRNYTNGAGHSSLQLWCVPTPRGIAFAPVLDPLDPSLHEVKVQDTIAKPIAVLGERLVRVPDAMLRIIPEWAALIGPEPERFETSMLDGSEA